MPNAELMLSTLDHVREHPEEWNQVIWYAETRTKVNACYASRALLLSGVRIKPGWRALVVAETLPEEVRETALAANPELKPYGYAAVRVSAMALLDLTEEQAVKLFDGGNSLDDLESLVAQILASGVDEFTEQQTEPIPF